VRLQELDHLERCERTLAGAYRFHEPIAGVPEATLQHIAQQHLEHARLLRERIIELGGTPSDELDDAWISSSDLVGLRRAERHALATFHDHLTDFDHTTAHAIREHLIPAHLEALATLDPHYAPDRDGDI
jgi:hypothetical protein